MQRQSCGSEVNDLQAIREPMTEDPTHWIDVEVTADDQRKIRPVGAGPDVELFVEGVEDPAARRLPACIELLGLVHGIQDLLRVLDLVGR